MEKCKRREPRAAGRWVRRTEREGTTSAAAFWAPGRPGARNTGGGPSQLLTSPKSPSGCPARARFQVPFSMLPKPPQIRPALGRMTRASDGSCTTFPCPGQPSASAPIHWDAHWKWGCGPLSCMESSPTVSGGEGASQPGCRMGFFPSLSSRARSVESASGMGDSTSLPGRLPHCQEAQVCKGSAGLQPDWEAEAADAWAARSR